LLPNTHSIQPKEYLIDNSIASEEFIEAFFDIQDHILSYKTEFYINLEIVVQWLHAVKKNLYETLKNSYDEHFDYKILPRKKYDKKWGGQNKKTIMLTSECFKRLCIRSNTPVGRKWPIIIST
jgi:hypothetical protein